MPRETAAVKAGRLLTEGRVSVLHVREEIRATVAGDSGTYLAGWTPAEWWSCSCANPRRNCSHLRALRAVVPEPEVNA